MPKTTIPTAERLRGCCWAANYSVGGAQSIQKSGGVITGAPSYDSDKGIRLAGAEYITYPASVTGQPLASGFVSGIIECSPGFSLSDAGNKYIFSSVAPRLFFLQVNKASNKLLLYGGNTTKIYDIALASVEPYWKSYQRNVIAFTANAAGAQIIYINGVSLGLQSFAWSAGNINSLVVGERIDDTGKFLGHIHSIKFFKHATAAELLTAGEALGFWNRDTYTYASRATTILPLGSANHAVLGGGTEKLVDGFMEAAGTAAWSVSGGTLTKDTTLPHSGIQCLRVTGASGSYAYQTVTTATKMYKVTGWARGNGTAIPTLHDSVTTFWTGTSSTSWQPFDLLVAWGSVSFRIRSVNGAGADWCEFDDISVVEYTPQTLDASPRGNNFVLGDGLTAATMPTRLPTRGYSFDGGDYLTRARLWTSETAFTVCCLADVASIVSNQCLVSQDRTDSSSIGYLLYITSTGEFHFYVGGPAGTQAAKTTARKGRVFLVGQWDGTNTKIWFNGVAGTNATVPTAPVYHVNDIVSVGQRGLAAGPVRLAAGSAVYYVSLYPVALTQTQILEEMARAVQNSRLP